MTEKNISVYSKTSVCEHSSNINLISGGFICCSSFQNKMFMTMNIFDFRNNYLDLSVFDIRKCFNDNQKHHFEITFSRKYSISNTDKSTND